MIIVVRKSYSLLGDNQLHNSANDIILHLIFIIFLYLVIYIFEDKDNNDNNDKDDNNNNSNNANNHGNYIYISMISNNTYSHLYLY